VSDEERLRDALESMVRQYANWLPGPTGGYWTGGMSALEEAFEALGWEDRTRRPRWSVTSRGATNSRRVAGRRDPVALGRTADTVGPVGHT
jgi:hypothetical protein